MLNWITDTKGQKGRAVWLAQILNAAFYVIMKTLWTFVSSSNYYTLQLGDVHLLYGQVVEDKTGKDRVYTKWKPPRNKLTQEIQRKKGAKRKSVVSESSGDLTRCVVKVQFSQDFVTIYDAGDRAKWTLP